MRDSFKNSKSNIANYRLNYGITVFLILIIPIYQLFMIYKGRVNNKLW